MSGSDEVAYPKRTGATRAKAKKRARARVLRRAPTPAEARVWALLRRQGFAGMRWRRQVGVQGFIVDFYCPKHGLVLEIDGSVHDTPEAQRRDAHRTSVIESKGLRVIRLTNTQTLDPTTIAQTILDAISAPSPHTPSPPSEPDKT